MLCLAFQCGSKGGTGEIWLAGSKFDRCSFAMALWLSLGFQVVQAGMLTAFIVCLSRLCNHLSLTSDVVLNMNPNRAPRPVLHALDLRPHRQEPRPSESFRLSGFGLLALTAIPKNLLVSVRYSILSGRASVLRPSWNRHSFV